MKTWPIIDIDTHYTEPPDLWTSRAPARLRDRVPRVVERDGRQLWIVETDTPLSPPGFCVIRPDRTKLRGQFSLATFEQMYAAATDPKLRVADMDELGIHAQIIYPNALGFGGNSIMRLADTELRRFCVTAYNDAVAELQAAGRGRLYPQAIVPFWDRDFALEELRRAHEELGLTGFTMTDSPQEWGLPCLNEPHWEPLWELAQEKDLPVNFHIGSGAFGGAWTGYDVPQMVATSSVMLFMNNMRCLTNLIFSGLLDRFPRLKFVSVESGIGWLPFLLEACEYQMDENMPANYAKLELRPRDYFQRQIYASYWFEEENVADSIRRIGFDNVMFETDFPHPTCLYPHVQEHAQKTLASLPESAQRKILYETASKVYGVPVPAGATH